MFYGEYEHSIDNKGRLIMPAKFRDAAIDAGVERFFLTRGLDKCIFMFAESEWRIQEQRFRNMSFTKEQARWFNRLFFAGAVDVLPDKQGRFIIPSYLKDFANIKTQTMVIGVSNRIEIWDTAAWKHFYTNTASAFEKTAETLLDLN